MPMIDVYLGLGANLGDARGTIVRAIEKIAALETTALRGQARWYRTRPIGPPGQPDYVNTAVWISTSLEPRVLLSAVKAIERELGRVPSERWGARAIDIDILIYGEVEQRDAELTIPHAELASRRFVLAPLLDLAPELIVPRYGRSVRALYEVLEDDPAGVALES